MDLDWGGSWEDARPAARRVSPVLAVAIVAALVAAGVVSAASGWTAATERPPEAISDRGGQLARAVGSYPTEVLATVVTAAGNSWTHRGSSESTIDDARDGCIRIERSADGPVHLTDELCGTAEAVTLTELTLGTRGLDHPLVLACDSVVVVGVPTDQGSCSSPDTTAIVRTDTSPGRETVAVGRQLARTVHVGQTLELEGSLTGAVRIDRWFVENGGPEVRTYVSMSWHRPRDPVDSFALLQSAWSSATPLPHRLTPASRTGCSDCPPPPATRVAITTVPRATGSRHSRSWRRTRGTQQRPRDRLPYRLALVAGGPVERRPVR